MVLTTSRCHQHAASTDVRPNKLAEKAEACRSLDTFCRSDARLAVVAFRRCRFAVHRLPLRSLLSFLILLRIMLSVLGRDSSCRIERLDVRFYFFSGGTVSGYLQALHFVRMCLVHVHFVANMACFTTNILSNSYVITRDTYSSNSRSR